MDNNGDDYMSGSYMQVKIALINTTKMINLRIPATLTVTLEIVQFLNNCICSIFPYNSRWRWPHKPWLLQQAISGILEAPDQISLSANADHGPDI